MSHFVELARVLALAVSFSLFLFAYFPSSAPVEDGKDDIPIPSSWQRRVGQLVLVLVDALRADFVLEIHQSSRQTSLPKIKYLQDKLMRDEALGFTLRCSPPTVTLPRIKAMLTGRQPTYLDVVNNINSDKLAEDSLLTQLDKSGLKMVMFGDETWERISPVRFIRSDPTSSFFVSDYTEVDDNVTRHLDVELQRDDWDLMILHYLGLDHIGHLEGPDSKLIEPKLDEMGNIIEKIYTALLNKESKNELAAMVVVVGDHGMADGGGHGGASLQEVLVPLVVLSPLLDKQEKLQDEIKEYLQLDLAPSFSFLMGSRIPRSSNGRIISELTGLYSEKASQDAKLYNSLQLKTLLDSESRTLDIIQEAQMKMKSKDSSSQEEVSMMLEEALARAQEELITKGAQYDVYLLMLSILAIFTSSGLSVPYASKVWQFFLGFVFIQSVHFLICSFIDSCICSRFYIFPLINIYLLLSLGGTVTVFVKHLKKQTEINFVTFLLILHSVSLLSSSFVEEEHQTYYFMFTTLLYYIGLNVARQKKWRTMYSLSVCAGLHRFLRGVNQTGDKWKHLPDTSDLIHESENFKQTILILSLILLVFIMHKSHKNTLINCSLSALIACAKYSSSVITVQFVYCFLFLRLLYNRSLFEFFLFLSCVLHCEANVLCIVLFVTMLKLVPNCDPTLLYLMSKCFHFYLGNSNSLASIQVGAGYTGLSEYSAVPVVILLAVHTYTGLLITFSYAVQHGARTILSSELTWIRVDLVVFTVLSFMLRYHIFVWSVFSPRLLYFGMELVVFLVFYMLCFLF